MADTSVSKGTYSSALATGVTAFYLQNKGPGVAFVRLAAAAPTEDAGAVGYQVQAGSGISMSGLDGSENLYVGAAVDEVSIEYHASTA